MNTDQILKVLKNERECIARQTGHSEHKIKPDWQLIEIDYIHGYKKWLCNHCGITIYNTLYEEMENVPCGCMKENKCDRKCENCDLCLPDDEILEVYDHLIKIIENEAIQIADVSEEDKAKIVQSLASAGYNISPELAEKYLGVVDEFSRDYFKGICPYTNKKCEKWTCNICEVEERERKFMEGDTD